jgi:hypothetical protein
MPVRMTNEGEEVRIDLSAPGESWRSGKWGDGDIALETTQTPSHMALKCNCPAGQRRLYSWAFT